jgi:integrase
MSNTSLAKRSGSALVPARVALVKATAGELPAYVRADEVAQAVERERRTRVKVFLRFLWLTGARVSEALAVRVGDVDFRARLARVRTLKRRKPQTRTIPLPPEHLGELAVLVNTEGLTGGDRLFPWSRSRAFELVRDALVTAGVERPRAHPHALRHGHAVHALQGGAPLNVVQRALGHASITTTSVYLSVTGDDVRRFYSGIAW